MPQFTNDPLLNALAYGTIVASLLTTILLLTKRPQGLRLAYEPRRLVPWNGAATILAIVLVSMVFAALLAGPGDSVSPASGPPQDPTQQLLATSLSQIVIVGSFLFVVAVYSRASLRDLGLPTHAGQLARDIGLGLVAVLVALAPVHIVQLALVSLLFSERHDSGHWLVQLLTASPSSFGLLVAATLAAVVVAPVCEEIAFRLLFQGWLEKWEDQRLMTLGNRRTAPTPVSPSDIPDGSAHDLPLIVVPPEQGTAGLPHGWFPILASALLFGIAHYGYGPEPVPLYMLGIVLGYLYQRTHRIVPGIIAHAAFNAFTMVALWRLVLLKS